MTWKHPAVSNGGVDGGLCWFPPLASREPRCVEDPWLPEAPSQGSHACVLATGLWRVRTRSKELCDTQLWATEEICTFALFLICSFITQEHCWCALVFCWINWILNSFMHISRTRWIEISSLFFHSCFLFSNLWSLQAAWNSVWW